ncbi:uncharacterized protein LOC133730499 [Rosa rugosa]|uniref:uncharacterized protein LOC133730499 n=1 Tax=Rosa rugosa TaxID=74645 RepID=UPI002B413256|nr:uncharacterized protein LOC133730499 [Rosa rugosa]
MSVIFCSIYAHLGFLKDFLKQDSMRKSLRVILLPLFLCLLVNAILICYSYSDSGNSVLANCLTVLNSDFRNSLLSNCPTVSDPAMTRRQRRVTGDVHLQCVKNSGATPRQRKIRRNVSLQSTENIADEVCSRKRNKYASTANINPYTSTSITKEPENAANISTYASTSNNREPENATSCGNSIGQAFYQRKRCGETSVYSDIGDMSYVCIDCNALFWLNESKKQVSKNNPPIYTKCCQEGRIKLEASLPTPPFLEHLLDPNNGRHFRENIRAYNSMFAFTSMGAKIDETINDGSGPYIFKISGQVHHLMGSLLPIEGESPKFAQLYIYDTHNEVANRLHAIEGLNPEIVGDLIKMFDEVNELVRFFRNVRNKYDDHSLRSLNLTILDHEENREKQYEQPTCDEVAGLVVGDIGLYDLDKDIIAETHDGRLERISKIHPKYMSLQYPILFPYGEDGYKTELKMLPPKGNRQYKREKVSMRSFIAYQVQERYNQSDTLLKGGRLFQQFLVDAYATIEESRLHFLRKNQSSLRSDAYKGVCDAVSRGDNDARNLGQKVILPSSHTGSPRYMMKNYQDAMAICRQYGHPDLFITFTCNVKWPEISRALENKHGCKPEDRPDIVSRVFKMKHDDLLSYIKSGKPFGEIEAATDIDSIICAELPDRNTDPSLYKIVSQFMIHGPCGQLNLKAPCMRDGKCSKFFPKSYKANTIFETNVAPIYRRRDDETKFVIKNGVQIDNRFVVPYNRDLLLRYNAHINVESCSQSMLIKYLFKYINKGPDRARVGFKENLNDEIQTYLNCRYISPPEAVWRLFEYPIHSRHPAVELLPVHMPGEQNIIFSESQSLESIISNKSSEDTMLTAWFKANENYHEAKPLTYAEFPSKFVWDHHNKLWTPRKKGYSIGRIANVYPTSGELYYLRLLLNTQRGCSNYTSVRTIDNIVYPSYQDACRAIGLLGDDKEWSEALTNALYTASCSELRHLFVTIILFCDVANPEQLFNAHWQHMCDDIVYKIRSDFTMPNLIIPDSELQNSLLFELEQIFNASSSSLKDHKLPMPNEHKMLELKNKLLREELDYDCLALQKEHSILVPQLNDDQRIIYENVIQTVSDKSYGLFFVYGHGGTELLIPDLKYLLL